MALGAAYLEADLHYLFLFLLILIGCKANKAITLSAAILLGLVMAYFHSAFNLEFLIDFVTFILLGLWIGHGMERIRHLVHTDPLTEVYNRRYFLERLESEWNRSSRYSQMFSLVILDLDDFKLINDRYGNMAGDLVLQEVATMIQNEIRNCDTIGRLGGEEFGVIFPNTSAEDVRMIMERINLKLKTSRFAERGTLPSFSAGIAEYHKEFSMQELYNQADHALYEAKENKNQVKIYIKKHRDYMNDDSPKKR